MLNGELGTGPYCCIDEGNEEMKNEAAAATSSHGADKVPSTFPVLNSMKITGVGEKQGTGCNDAVSFSTARESAKAELRSQFKRNVRFCILCYLRFIVGQSEAVCPTDFNKNYRNLFRFQ